MHRSIVNTASLRQLHYFKSAEYLCLFLNSCPLVALLIFPPSNWHFAMNRSIVHHGVTLTGTEQTRRLQDQFPPLVVVAVKALYISERALVSVYLFKSSQSLLISIIVRHSKRIGNTGWTSLSSSKKAFLVLFCLFTVPTSPHPP